MIAGLKDFDMLIPAACLEPLSQETRAIKALKAILGGKVELWRPVSVKITNCRTGDHLVFVRPSPESGSRGRQ